MALPSTWKAEYANLGPGEAALKGRAEKIDVSKWDEQKEELMQDILYAQVIQTPTLKHALMKFDFRDKDPLLNDPFWKKTLPIIWMSIKQRLLKKEASDDASDDASVCSTHVPLSASSWILSYTWQHQVRLREAMREAANICAYVSSSIHFRGYRARSAGVGSNWP